MVKKIILNNEEIAPILDDSGQPISSFGRYLELALENISPDPNQPRRFFDESKIAELSESIAQQGMLQPIVVRKNKDNKYIIIAGERRWRAATKLGLRKIPAIEKNFDEESVALAALIENLQREDLNPIEEARALQNLSQSFNMNHEQIANKVGRSRTAVTNTLRLLTLSPNVQAMLVDQTLSAGHAKVLLTLSSEEQEKLAKVITDQKLTVREAEKLVFTYKSPMKQAKHVNIDKHKNCPEWARLLSDQLSTNVSVKLNEQGVGKVVIDIQSLSEIEWLIKTLSADMLTN